MRELRPEELRAIEAHLSHEEGEGEAIEQLGDDSDPSLAFSRTPASLRALSGR